MSVDADPADASGQSLPVTGGAFVAVVGPSGAGKDTLLNYARQALARDEGVFFVRRVITRPADSAPERHLPVTEAEFEKMKGAGRFAVTWPAHNRHYGVPLSVDDEIRNGHTAVCNGSRAALEGLQARYANFAVISISARRDVLADRLAARGRENRNEILARLERSAPFDAAHFGALQIENSGAITTAGDALVTAIRTVCRTVA